MLRPRFLNSLHLQFFPKNNCRMSFYHTLGFFFLAFWRGGLGAVLGISAISATFSCSFPAFWAGLGCCLGNFCGFSYFFLLFSSFLAGFVVCYIIFVHYTFLAYGFNEHLPLGIYLPRMMAFSIKNFISTIKLFIGFIGWAALCFFVVPAFYAAIRN